MCDGIMGSSFCLPQLLANAYIGSAMGGKQPRLPIQRQKKPARITMQRELDDDQVFAVRDAMEIATSTVRQNAKEKMTEEEICLLNVKLERDKIDRYRKNLKAKLEKAVVQIRDMVRDNRRSDAKVVIRHHWFLDKLIATTSKQLESVCRMVKEVEWAQVQRNAAQAMLVASQLMQQIAQEMPSVDELENTRKKSRLESEFTVSDVAVERVLDDIEIHCEAKAGVSYEERLKMCLPSVPEVSVLDLSALENRQCVESAK